MLARFGVVGFTHRDRNIISMVLPNPSTVLKIYLALCNLLSCRILFLGFILI